MLWPWLLLLGVVLAHLAAVRFLRRESWATLGLGRDAARPAHFVSGTLVGLVAIGVPSAALVAVGWLRWEPAAPGSSLAAALALLLFLAPAAMFEELLVRGYPFAVLRRAAGDGAAVLATSLVFALMHVANGGATLQSLVQAGFAGVWLGGILVLTGSLYAAWAAHLAWNWFMAAVLHAPVSGLALAAPDYRFVDAGPDWATGGAWGPEAGLGATVGMAGTLVLLFARRQRRGET